MGRKPRQSGYSSREKTYRSVIAKGASQYHPGNLPPRLALPLDRSQSTQPQQWEPTAQPNILRHPDHWQPPDVPIPANSPTVASYHPSGFANSATADPTVQSEYEQRTSPEANTPTNSTVTLSDAGYGGPSRLHGDHATSLSEDGFSQMTDDVIGIDNRFSVNDTIQLIQKPEPKFIHHQIRSPSNYHRSRRTNEPWTPVQYQPQVKIHSMDTDMHDDSDHTHSLEGREKGGGRTGPLSMAQRQQASDVRRMGACLRCQIMREKCDLKIPCHTCETKDRRKFPKKCIRSHFDWESQSSIYLPDELTLRLKQDKLFQYLSQSSFTVSSRPEFTVKLELNIDDKLWVVVKEFAPLDLSIRHAHRSISDDDGNRSYQRLQVWNPPIIMRVREGELPTTITSLRQKLRSLFTGVLSDDVKWTNWSMRYFFHIEEDFQCDLLIWIGKYYRDDIEEHSILSTALSLLWWDYLLLNKITVAQDDVANLESKLEAKRPAGSERMAAIPETINRFVKAIILPIALETAKKLTETLHERLFRMAVTQKQSQSGTDIAACLMLVLIMFMGSVQSTLLLLSDTPGEEIEMEYSLEAAKARILEIEESIIELWTSFHRYTLSRRGGGTTSKSTLSAKEVNSKAEVYAREYDLMGKMKKEIEGQYVKDRPTDLAVGANHGYELDGFRAANVTRLCWKVWANIDSGVS